MRWPWSDPDRIQSGDILLSCPDCGGNTECRHVAILRTPVQRRGHVVSVVVGDVYRCERCGGFFAVSHRGTFKPYQPPQLPAPDPNGVTSRISAPRLKQAPKV